VKAVTETTKKIEADISVGVWDKQKRWQMKREVLFEAAKRLSGMDDALVDYGSTMQIDLAKQTAWATAAPSQAERQSWMQTKIESATKASKAITALAESRLFVAIVCGKVTKEAFTDLAKYASGLAVQIGNLPDAYRTAMPDLQKKVEAAQNAIRKELEVDA
jgi:uncharacterized protein (DUF2252 family)